ncbi:MAG: T9SS type A sorting domain-containing protein [Bacteroidota bacterium]
MQKKNFIICLIIGLMSVVGQAQIEVEIFDIQGEGSRSPLVNQIVTTRGVITAIADDRFYIQTSDELSDLSQLTSNGILVYVNDRINFDIGDEVRVTGQVLEFEGQTEIETDISFVSLFLAQAGLPEPTLLNANLPSGTPGFPDELEQVEGMYVELSRAFVAGPSDENNRVYINPRRERSFREAGIAFPGRIGLPLWDGNPEVIRFDPVFLLNSRPTLSAGMEINARGVLSEINGQYRFLAEGFSVNGGPVLRAVRAREAGEVTTGTLNAFVFAENEPDYAVRRRKIARYVVDQMGAPDILALQEVQNSIVLNDLVEEIKQLYPDIDYSPYIIGGSTNGDFSIQTCFLLRPTIQNVNVQQLAANESLSIGGRLHDRPPLLLQAEFASTPPTPISVLNLHLRSLNGIEGGDATFVRLKRHQQSISVANIIQNLQNENLIVLGDLNAFQFSDGYVDVLAQLTGQSSLGAEFPVQDIVAPPLINHTTNLPAEEQYSFIFRGNSQILDHILSNELTDITVKGAQFARGNADNPITFLDDNKVPYKASDHDGLVLFMELDAAITTAVRNVLPEGHQILLPNPFGSQDRIQFQLAQKERLTLQLYSPDGRLVSEQQLGLLPAGRSDWMPLFQLPKGLYLLRFSGKDWEYSKKIVIKGR